MSRDAQEVRYALQMADYLLQCGDGARAAALYIDLAARYAQRHRTQEAAAICYRVLHVDPTQFVDVAVGDTLRVLGRAAAPICMHAAELHRAQGRYGDAVRMVQLAAAIDPADALAAVRVAEILLEQHDYVHAVAALFEAGQRLLRAGNNADFLHVADQILAIDPTHAATLRELARTHVRLGEPHRAVNLLAQLMRVCPEDPAGYEILAHAFASIGRIPKALAILTRLVHDHRRRSHETAAQQMLDRAHWWSADPAYRRVLTALREQTGPGQAQMPAPVREQTVMLSIDDLVIEEERDLEGTLVLAIDDIAFVEASKHRARRPVLRKAPPPVPTRRPVIARDEDTTAVRRRPVPPPLPTTARAGVRGVPGKVPKAPTRPIQPLPPRLTRKPTR